MHGDTVLAARKREGCVPQAARRAASAWAALTRQRRVLVLLVLLAQVVAIRPRRRLAILRLIAVVR